jgi:hypothetical protein
MSAYIIPNATEPMTWLTQFSTQVPIFFPAVLYMILIVFTLAGYMSETRRTGYGKIFKWFAIASYITTILGFILFLQDGLIPLYHVILLLTITIITTMAYIFDSRGEQNVI